MLKNKISIILCLVILAGACTGVRAPGESVPKRKALETDAFGGWIIINPGSPEVLMGELISHTDESVFIMTNVRLEEIAKSQIDSARLIMYNTQALEYSLWTTLGSLSTLSNGYFLAFTFPMWLVTGIPVSTGEVRRQNYLDYPETGWSEIAKFARFPQGMPAGINPLSLWPRPPQ
jgi:hypothetical protein